MPEEKHAPAEIVTAIRRLDAIDARFEEIEAAFLENDEGDGSLPEVPQAAVTAFCELAVESEETVDNAADWLTRVESVRDGWKAQAAHATTMAKFADNILSEAKTALLDTLRERPENKQKLIGKLKKIYPQKNGGVEALVIDDPAAVPLGLHTIYIRVALPADETQAMEALRLYLDNLNIDYRVGEPEADEARIRAELERNNPVAGCKLHRGYHLRWTKPPKPKKVKALTSGAAAIE